MSEIFYYTEITKMVTDFFMRDGNVIGGKITFSRSFSEVRTVRKMRRSSSGVAKA